MYESVEHSASVAHMIDPGIHWENQKNQVLYPSKAQMMETYQQLELLKMIQVVLNQEMFVIFRMYMNPGFKW